MMNRRARLAIIPARFSRLLREPAICLQNPHGRALLERGAGDR
jgi:hypothetical protein